MSPSTGAAEEGEEETRRTKAEEFEAKFDNGEHIKDALELTEEIIGKLGIGPLSKEAVFKALQGNRKETWRNLLSLESSEDAIKAAGGDEDSGTRLWNSVQDYKNRRERYWKAEGIKRQKILSTDLPKGTMTNFLGHLPEAKFVDSRVELNEKTYLVGDPVMFIRDCFPHLYETVKDRVLKGKFISLTGTPGLGKSMFAYYVALRLLREQNVAVIFIHLGWDETHLFLPKEAPNRVKAILAKYEPLEKKEGGWLGRLLGVSPALLAESEDSARKLYLELTCLVGDVVVILDPPRDFGDNVFKPPSTGLFIATSCPARSTSADMQGGLAEVYFPIWPLDEVHRLLRERMQRELTPKEFGELESRFLLFGGVPRWIARPNTSHEEMVSIALQKTKKAIASVSSLTLVDMFNPRSSQPEVSGLLIHLKVVNDEFTETRKKFASAMVEVELYLRFYNAGRVELRHFLTAARRIEGFKQAAGNLYEHSWHIILQHGAEVELEELFDRKDDRGRYPPNSKKQKIKLPPTASRYSARQNLDDVSDLRPAPIELGTFLHVLAYNVPSVDALSVIPMRIADTIFGSVSSTTGPNASGPFAAVKTRKRAAEANRHRPSQNGV